MQLLELSNLIFIYIIPLILLFYLLKRKYENYQISSILLWKKMLKDQEANKPWQRLRKNILLFLQLLIATLLIMALLRPAIESDNLLSKHTIIVIDSSGSMLALEEDNRNRFDIAKDEINKLIDKKNDEQYITLIDMNQTPNIVISKSSDKTDLKQALNSVEARNGAGDDYATFTLAKTIALFEDSSGIVWFGDGTNYKLNEMNESLPENVKFQHLQIGSKNENLSLAIFITQKTEDNIIGLLRIDNYGSSEKNAKVNIYNYQNEFIDTYNFTITAEGSYSIELSNLPQSEAYYAELEQVEDALIEDNIIWSVPFDNQGIDTILISEEGNHFLSQALSAGHRTNLKKADTYPLNKNTEADIWIFDGLVPSALPDGNVLIVGPNISTEWLKYFGEKDVNEDIKATNPTHELLKYVIWKDVHISKISKIDKISGLETLIKIGDDPLLLAGNYQGRKIIILTFDIHNSDFPLRASFPILIQNIVEYLSPSNSIPISNTNSGENIAIQSSLGVDSRIVITPKSDKIELSNSSSTVTFTDSDQIGLYTLEETKDYNKEVRYFSVQFNNKESYIKSERIKIATINSNINEGETGLNNDKVFKEITDFFILLALLIIFVEWMVYKRGY